MVVEKVLQYKIITDHPNTNAIRMKLLLVQNGLTYTTKTLFKEEEKVRAKMMGIKSFPTVYTSKDEMIGGLVELASWIDDDFQTFFTERTDLDMYYEKVGLVYGQSSGRPIEPDYPSNGLDIQPKIDEFRIVGPKSGAIGITSIKAGDGVTATTDITVTLESALFGLNVKS